MNKILIVRKMSALEYYYNGKHNSRELREGSDNHNHSVKVIERVLRKSGMKFDVITRKELSKKLIREYDAVISAGGDGTVIAVAAYNLDTPQLNLKTEKGSEGALCQEDIKKTLESFLKGNYIIEEWQRQDVFMNGKLIGRASNETCVGEGLRFDKLARYDFAYMDADDGLTKKEYQSGSGLVIVTGTGSTAWPAAFKAFPRSTPYFRFRTLLQHSGKIEMGKASEARLIYRGHEGKFSIDTKDYGLRRDSVLEIKLSKNPLRVVVVK